MGLIIELRKIGENNNVIMTWKSINFENFKYDINTPVSALPLPEENQTESILIKVEGNSGAINMSFVVKDSNENMITGSGFTGNSAALFDQIRAVREQFRPVSLNDQYQVALVSGTTDLMVWNGTISQTTFIFSGNTPVSARVNIVFMEGNVQSAYNQDTPKPPTNIRVINGGVGELIVSWTPPTDTGTGNPPIVGYRIQYIGGDDILPTTSDVPPGTNHTITGLTSGAQYFINVAARTLDGIGEYSVTRDGVPT